jgi:NTP pyrophosphatase (non-canonical NTP hydrolase)
MENQTKSPAELNLIDETPFNNAAREINTAMTQKGFWENTRNIPYMMSQGGFTAAQIVAVRKAFRAQKLALITSELTEALEADRKSRQADLQAFNENEAEGMCFIENFEATIKDTFEDELGDAFIRILDLAGGEGINLDKHVALKSKYNATRAKMHGKEF